ncbi:MAG: DNA polymerase I [Patescibacteria group bacterium]|nr:DNA polymerase I [Patescibacteria group bacterium]MDE2438467.1 DNA polymerase I [Patescibacteria group bacterium]
MKTLLLIDANALIHRAFYALPPMTDSKGNPVNALYGLSSILLRVVREMKPDYVAAAFDLPEPTFRHKEYKEYKAQRKKASPELIAQLKVAPRVFEAFGMKVMSAEGFEADDVIATLAEKFRKEPRLHIMIITGDMDTLQLVEGKKVEVCTMKKGIGETTIYDETGVEERFGITPAQLPDFKGLKGDPSDNIPGVPGIGEKTAVTLLQEFKTLENLYDRIRCDKELIPAKTYAKLIEHKDQAFFSKYLAITRRDLPLNVTLDDLAFLLSVDSLKSLFESYHFRSLLLRLQESSSRGVSNPKKEEETASTALICSAFSAIPHTELALSCEDGRLCLTNRKGAFCYIEEDHDVTLLSAVYADTERFIAYDAKGVIRWHMDHGVALPRISFDCMIAAWLLDPEYRDYGLRALTKRMFKKEGGNEYIFSLYDAQLKKLVKYELMHVFSDIEMPLIPILATMERRGIALNVSQLNAVRVRTETELNDLERDIFSTSDSSFNINSPKQLSEVLFTLLKLPTKGLRKTPQGAISTDAGELAKLRGAHPIIDLILRYRELNKLKTTYLDALPKSLDAHTGRLHTTFNQTGTATGRLSSSDPNLQNIPAQGSEAVEIRNAFVAEKGFQFAAFDYSQLELRIVAALSQDATMMNAFLEKKDIHAITAAEVNGISLSEVTPELRRQAKTLNFGIIYGMGARAFAESSGLSLHEAKRFIQKYFENFKGIKAYQDSLIGFAKTYGYVKTESGRRRYLPDITSGNPKFQAQAERAAINMPVQGLEADIVKQAMINADTWIKEQNLEETVRLLLNIHDELLFEIEKEKVRNVIAPLRGIMEQAFPLAVPLVVDIKMGDSWGSMQHL